MNQWHGSCKSNIRMKQIPILGWPIIRKELIDGGRVGYSRISELSKIRKLAQHYLNGLRIAAFLVRHGFNRMKVRHFVSIYESCIYPVLYQKLMKIN
jgi:hypothetical protein